MILEVSDYEILWRISQLIDKGCFKYIDYTANEFFKYLLDEWDIGKIKVFVSINDKKEIDGFVICSLIKDIVRKKNQVFIDLAYVDKEAPKETGQELLNRVEDYAKSLNIDEICGYSLKGERAMFKKYGFELDYSVFIKRIKNMEVKSETKETTNSSRNS